MVLRVDVVEAALAGRYGAAPPAGRRVIALSAGGRQLDDALAVELAAEPELTLLCGRYEGFDERVHEHLATDVVSIGPYVLAGGELAAMVLCDAVLRKLPGALGHEQSAVEESFSAALEGAPEYPHYTRPFDWRGHAVPEVLLSGDHGRIREWRRDQSRARGAASATEGAPAGPLAFATIAATRDSHPAVAPLLCPESSKASSAPSCAGCPPSRRATACACISRSWRAPAGAPRCSRAW